MGNGIVVVGWRALLEEDGQKTVVPAYPRTRWSSLLLRLFRSGRPQATADLPTPSLRRCPPEQGLSTYLTHTLQQGMRASTPPRYRAGCDGLAIRTTQQRQSRGR